MVYIYVQASKCDSSTGSVTPVLVAPAGNGVAQASAPKERCENPWQAFRLPVVPHLHRGAHQSSWEAFSSSHVRKHVKSKQSLWRVLGLKLVELYPGKKIRS